MLLVNINRIAVILVTIRSLGGNPRIPLDSLRTVWEHFGCALHGRRGRRLTRWSRGVKAVGAGAIVLVPRVVGDGGADAS